MIRRLFKNNLFDIEKSNKLILDSNILSRMLVLFLFLKYN